MVPTISTVISVFPVTDNVRSSGSTSSIYAAKSSTKVPSSSNVNSSGRTIVGASLTGLIVT